MYKLMKTFTNKVEGIEVYSSRTEFRRYCIEVNVRGIEYKSVYQNNKPTIKEIKEIKRRLELPLH